MLAAARRLLPAEDARALALAARRGGSGSGGGGGARVSLSAPPSPADPDAGGLLGGGDDPTTLDGFLWDWQYCSEMLMPFGKDGLYPRGDFYWPEPFDLGAAIDACRANWAGLTPRVGWAVTHYGGRGALRAATRITFPSGALDPWRPGSPLELPPPPPRKAEEDACASAASSAAPLLDAFTIASGAHHIDTFFSDEADPPDVTAGRARILDLLARWLDDARAERARAAQRQQRQQEGGGGLAGAAARTPSKRQDQVI
jgi:lysosomal Pro-X carboxypeptidase